MRGDVQTLIIIVVLLVALYVLVSRPLGVIHTLVNSNLTRVTADLELAKERIQKLEAHIAREKGDDGD